MRTITLGSVALGICVGVAAGQVGMPEVVITPVAHQGDPVAAIPGATFAWLCIPQIDAAGNVLFFAELAGPDIDGSNNLAMFYGPPGDLEVIARESWAAPDMPPGVIMTDLLWAAERLSETGWIGFTAELSGPGIVEGVNYRALFVGPVGDFQKVLQGGDQAPGLEPGIVMAPDPQLAAMLSDNATLLVPGWLSGPGVDYTNDDAYWIGSRDELEIIWREGMPAPGTEPGVTFDWADLVVFNDAGQITFRGGLEGPGVDDTNDVGYWTGPPGALELVARAGEPAWGCGEGIVYHSWGTNAPSLNAQGDVGYWMLLAQEGLPADEDRGVWCSTAEAIHLIGRYGDPAPEIGPGVELASIGMHQINNRREVFYQVKYQGDTIDSSNEWAMYFGPYENPRLTLRNSDPAPHFPDGTVLWYVNYAPVLGAMNDAGEIVTTIEIAGPDVTEENKVVLWIRSRVLGQWVPLLRTGTVIDARIVYASYPGDLGDGYNNRTSGSDGQAQSFNDAGQLAIKLEFTDGSHGIFRIEPPVFGDADADGDVDLDDWAAVHSCVTGVGGTPLGEGCELFDFDWDGDVDLTDLAVFQRLFGRGQ